MTWFPHRVHCETIASVPPELKEKNTAEGIPLVCDECEKSWLAEHVYTFKTVCHSQEAERFPVIRNHQVELNTVGKLWWLKCATETKKIN